MSSRVVVVFVFVFVIKRQQLLFLVWPWFWKRNVYVRLLFFLCDILFRKTIAFEVGQGQPS